MTIQHVPQTGQYGVNADLSAHELPINAWTDALNIRFLDGSVSAAPGYQQIYDPPSVVPYHVLPVNVAGARYWVYAGSGKIYAVNGTTHTDLTRGSGGDYTGSGNGWTSCSLSGIPILNAGNIIDPPQSWDLNIANNFGALANWPASTYAKVMRSFKNYLVALNITKTTTNYPYMVKWSHAADPGSVPSSWDPTDATKDAGEYDLATGGDIIVDGAVLRSSLMIYKQQSVWRMDYVGGQFVFRFDQVLGTSGSLTRNCIAELDGLHFVVTGSDIIVHDGQSATSVLDKQSRRHFFASLDGDAYDKTFVVKNPYVNEILVCYAESGATVPNRALVWNYVDKTLTFRDMPNVHHANIGLLESGLTGTWATDGGSWASDTTLWGQVDFTPDAARVVLASADTKLHLLDDSTEANGVQQTAYVERRGLVFGAPESRKLVKSIRPRIYGTDGETVVISVGYGNTPYEDPTYTDYTFTIGTDIAAYCLVDGRYIAIKFASGTAQSWRLDSYDVDYELTGAW